MSVTEIPTERSDQPEAQASAAKAIPVRLHPC